MIPILFNPEAEPEALLDVNAVPLHDTDDEALLASGDTSKARAFDNYGLGALTDCITCEVTEERNAAYELVMTYPMTGVHFNEIEERCVILAEYAGSLQAFRIYQITAPINGVITVNAQHLIYDLSGVPVLPFTAQNAAAACAGLMSHAVIDSPFEIATDIPTIADFSVDVPSSVRSWFGGRSGSMIDVYGGEWTYDNYKATLRRNRGEDRGVVIRYGVNLIDVRQETNISNMWTGVLPYWSDMQTGEVIRANIINVEGNFSFRRILCLDLSSDFQERPTAEELTAKARSYMTANKIGVPAVNITLDWAQSSETVELCDTVTVEFERLGISATAKCIRVVWDVLKERYSEIEIGDAKTTIAETIYQLKQEDEKAQSTVTSAMLRAINNATTLITGNVGGYVLLHDTDGDGAPDEILVMDTDDIATATKVWRWNKSGLGYSASGYGGTYGLAMTQDGAIVADFITAGTLSADRIKGGTITGVSYNNGSGTFSVDSDGNVTANSFSSSNAIITGGYLDLVTENIQQGITLKNAAGTTYTQHSASSRRRYANGTLILAELGGTLQVVSLTQTSDGREKKVLPGETPDLSGIRAVRFRWKGDRDDGREHVGYIAQEVETLAPEMVGEVDGVKNLDYIQVLVAKVERLERECELLKAMMGGRK